jgi:hypothetical protein
MTTPTPACRTYIIEAENRTLTVLAEGTGSTIAVLETSHPQHFAYTYWGNLYWGGAYWGIVLGGVSVTGTPTLRTLTIEAENRTLEIKACKDGG